MKKMYGTVDKKGNRKTSCKAVNGGFALLMVAVLVLAAAAAVLPLPAQAYVGQGADGATLGYWRFNNESGITAIDSSGRSNDGTWYGNTTGNWTTGIFGYGLDFDGVDDYVNASTTSFDSGSGSYESWLNFDTWANNQNDVIFSAPSEGPGGQANSETIGTTNTRIAQKFTAASSYTIK